MLNKLYKLQNVSQTVARFGLMEGETKNRCHYQRKTNEKDGSVGH